MPPTPQTAAPKTAEHPPAPKAPPHGAKGIRARDLVFCALFAALSAVLSPLTIPIGPVPVGLAHVSIFLAAGLLGAKYGAVSQVVFVLLGVMGVPVFSGFRGGLGVLAGPTGGFIVGYILCAFLVGLWLDRRGRSLRVLVPAMVCGQLVTYLPGLLWYMYLTQTGLGAALLVCVLPFFVGDAAKIALSAILIRKLWPRLHRGP
ncbi:MAG: biotin transporter BioY [Oscillospiraceae bacterium]|jgi:biotin transport system substrate-specific component|nr:biotin transporter BioY [Oscillospiraceae bacterium]